MGRVRTFRDLHALDCFIVDCASALLDEFVSLAADVKNLRVRDAKIDELLHRSIDDICSSL